MDCVCIRQYNSRTNGICYEINSDFLHSVVFEMKIVRIKGTVQHNIYQHFVCTMARCRINSNVTSGQ